MNLSSSAIFLTKLITPARMDGLLARPHLLDHLNKGLLSGMKVILLSAPAGYGKTSLVVDWIMSNSQEFDFAWLSLDPSDDNLERFFMVLAYSLEPYSSVTSELIRNLFSAPQIPSSSSLAGILINQLVHSQKKLVLVIDDYHLIHNSAIHAGMFEFIEHLPSNFHLVLSSRSDPPFPLHRLRARGQMIEVREADLRFSGEEFENFLVNQHLNLNEHELTILEESTEGWIAGIRLALLSLQHQADKADFIRKLSGNTRYIMDYLTAEILDQLDIRTRLFLIKTSILERLNPSLCDHLTDLNNSHTILQDLCRTNCFLFSLDPEHEWFRFHHLFRDLLQFYLKQQCLNDPTAMHFLHNKAADWYASHGFFEQAISHYIQSEEFSKAGKLVEETTFKLFEQGRLHSLLNWFDLLPRALLESRTRLGLMRIWAIAFAGDIVNAAELLNSLMVTGNRSFPTLVDEQNLNTDIQVICNFLEVSGCKNVQTLFLTELSKSELQLLTAFVQSVYYWSIGYAGRLQGDLLRAQTNFEEVLRLGHQMRNLWTIVTASADLGIVLRQQGKLKQAEAIYLQTLQMIPEISAPGYVGRLESFYGSLMLEYGMVSAAEIYIEKALRHNQYWQNPNHCAHAWLTKAAISIFLHKYDAAFQELDQAEEWIRKGTVTPNLSAVITTTRVKLFLKTGNQKSVLSWLENTIFQPVPDEKNIDEVEEINRLTAARIYLAQNDTDKTLHVLRSVENTARRFSRISTLIEALLIQAQAFSPRTNSLPLIRKALEIGLPAGFRKIFIDDRDAISSILPDCLEIEGAVELLAFLQKEDRQKATQTLLSQREIDVLRLMAAGFTNPQIGKKLFVSTGTVKAHSAAIFRKLDVTNRTEAIAVAKDKGLV